MDFTFDDSNKLFSDMNYEDKRLRIKRRWLMGLALSNYEQKKLENLAFENSRIVPESLLREDDGFYWTIKSCIQKGFGLCNVEKEFDMVQDSMQLLESLKDSRNLASLLDNMTVEGLFQFAMLVTGEQLKFQGRFKHMRMKKIIQERLPKIFDNQNNRCQADILKKITGLLMQPHNFCSVYMINGTPASESCRTAAAKIIDGLGDLPFRTLLVMHRKLRCVRGLVPELRPKRSGWRRPDLLKCVRNHCVKMLSKFSEGDELPEPLAKALAVAGLALKFIMNYPFVYEFQKFSPEVEALQNDIVHAIWLLDKKVSFPYMKNLQLFLDPDAQLSNRSFRAALRNLLTDFLLECSDLETIPESFLQTLAIINESARGSTYRPFSKEGIEDEVEAVLNIGAHMKQIVLDLLPEYEFDQYYFGAYMDDLEGSDESDTDEVIGSHNPFFTPNKWFIGPLERSQASGTTSVNSCGPPSSRISTCSPLNRISENCVEELPCGANLEKEKENPYLDVQKATDETSMMAHSLIGCLLDEFAQREGLYLDTRDISYLRGCASISKKFQVRKKQQTSKNDVVIEVLEKLIPSFPTSGMEKLRDLMGQK